MNVWEWDDPPKWWTSQDHQLHSDCCEQCYGSELFADIRDLAVRGSWRTAADRSAVELSQGSEKNYHEWSIFWGNQTWYQMLLVILRDFCLINNALFWGWCHINIMTPGYGKHILTVHQVALAWRPWKLFVCFWSLFDPDLFCIEDEQIPLHTSLTRGSLEHLWTFSNHLKQIEV